MLLKHCTFVQRKYLGELMTCLMAEANQSLNTAEDLMTGIPNLYSLVGIHFFSNLRVIISVLLGISHEQILLLVYIYILNEVLGQYIASAGVG